MLEFKDRPYVFVPPKPNRLVIWLARACNRYRLLPGPQNRVQTVCLSNTEVLRTRREEPQGRLLFLPNHPTHSDPHIMMEVQRRCRILSLFMAAYDVFVRSRFRAWVMQHTGAFSVDREGSDRQAMKQALQTFEQGRFALTIFPEGNVYLRNDCVAPFLEGAAYLAMKAQQRLGQAGRIYAVPVAIKLTHIDDPRVSVVEMLRRLAQEVGTTLSDRRRTKSPASRVLKECHSPGIKRRRQ